MEQQQQQERAGGRKERAVVVQREPQPPKRCPRCESTNTKFCYFNNYSSSQPRHFCKACRRYWTEGGTLRNVPQGGGGGNRRNKRPHKRSSSAAAASASNHSHLMLPNSAALAGEIGTGANPDALLMPPPQASFYYGGGLGLQSFHQAGGIIGDLGGFPMAAPAEVLPSGNPLLLTGFNFPLVEQQLLAPPLDSNLMIQQRAPPALSQQLNATVFTTTTTGPATTVASGGDHGEGLWNGDFAVVGGGEGRNGGWDADRYDSSGRGAGPSRPPPSSFI